MLRHPDDDYIKLRYHAWYSGNGALPVERQQCSMFLVEQMGPPLGILVNLGKCDFFGQNDIFNLIAFPQLIKTISVVQFGNSWSTQW